MCSPQKLSGTTQPARKQTTVASLELIVSQLPASFSLQIQFCSQFLQKLATVDIWRWLLTNWRAVPAATSICFSLERGSTHHCFYICYVYTWTMWHIIPHPWCLTLEVFYQLFGHCSHLCGHHSWLLSYSILVKWQKAVCAVVLMLSNVSHEPYVFFQWVERNR